MNAFSHTFLERLPAEDEAPVAAFQRRELALLAAATVLELAGRQLAFRVGGQIPTPV